MDVLSTVLKTVKLEGAMFYNAESSGPQSFRSPPSCLVAPYVSTAPRHVITYHLLTHLAGLCECRRRAANCAGTPATHSQKAISWLQGCPKHCSRKPYDAMWSS